MSDRIEDAVVVAYKRLRLAYDVKCVENQRLRDALDRTDGVARSAIAFVSPPYKQVELELRRVSARALAGTPSEDT